MSPTGPLVTTAPPFAVIGTADTPFLARLELAFSSPSIGGERQKVMLEHWVEVRRMTLSSSVASDLSARTVGPHAERERRAR